MKCLLLVIEFLILFELFGDVFLKAVYTGKEKKPCSLCCMVKGTKYQRVKGNTHCSKCES